MEELKTSLKPEDLASSLNATQYIVSGMIESSVNTMLVVKVLKNNENGKSKIAIILIILLIIISCTVEVF